MSGRPAWEADRGARLTLIIGLALSCLAVGACGGDKGSPAAYSGTDADAGTGVLPASTSLRSLDAQQLGSLCERIVSKITDASTPERQCTLQALSVSDSESTCESEVQRCMDAMDYDDWSQARCADFAAQGADPPSFDCSTKVSEVQACYEQAAQWLSGLGCASAAGDVDAGAAPACLQQLQSGPCQFDIDKLLTDLEFRARDHADAGQGFACHDASGDAYPYDLELGDACNACATGACCDSFVACLNDTACNCYLNCLDDESVCLKRCGLTSDPPDFLDHYDCLVGHCSSECNL